MTDDYVPQSRMGDGTCDPYAQGYQPPIEPMEISTWEAVLGWISIAVALGAVVFAGLLIWSASEGLR